MTIRTISNNLFSEFRNESSGLVEDSEIKF